MSAEKVALGRRLFYDVRLSGNGSQACASCHQQEHAFTDGRARAVGSTGETHPRGAMSLANAAYAASLTWIDAGQRSLEEQMLVPLLGEKPREMNLGGRETEIAARIGIDPLYSKLFFEAFPGEHEPMSLRNVQRAIGSFVRTIISGDSPYDRLVWKDDRGALSDPARRGMALFFSEPLACSKCHSGFTFSGPAAWEGGPKAEPTFHDNGVGGRFRAPTLRNIAVTAPYMHDGRFTTLTEVVDHYAKGGTPSPGRSPLVRGFTITEAEKRDLVEFLKSLTDEELLRNPLLADPWEKRPRSRAAVQLCGGSEYAGALLIAQVEAYYAAAKRRDNAAAQGFLAPDARIWFAKREGPGEPWKVSGGSWDHWDEYFNGRVRRSEWQTGRDFVSARGDETNDYYRLLDWKPWPMKLTWWFDASGHLNGFLVQSVVGKGTTGSRLTEFREWAKVNRPEQLQYLMPKGQIDPSADRAERWRKVLVEWRREAGLPSVELGPPGDPPVHENRDVP